MKEESKKEKKVNEKQRVETSQYKEQLEKSWREKSMLEKKVSEAQKRLGEAMEANKKLEFAAVTEGHKTWNTQKMEKTNLEIKERGEKVCIKYAKGRPCSYAQCRYQHVMMCKWILKGETCRNKYCKFGHDETTMCRWEARGLCRYGDRCRYVHANKSERGDDRKGESESLHEETRREGGRKMWRRNKYEVQEQGEKKNNARGWKEKLKESTSILREELKEGIEKLKQEMMAQNINGNGSNGNFWIPTQHQYPMYTQGQYHPNG